MEPQAITDGLDVQYDVIANSAGIVSYLLPYLLPYLGTNREEDIMQLVYCHILSKYTKIKHFFKDLKRYFIEFIDLYFMLIFNYLPYRRFTRINIKYFYLSLEHTKLFLKNILDLFIDLDMDQSYISSYLQQTILDLLSIYMSDEPLCINDELITVIVQKIMDNLFFYDLITNFDHPLFISLIDSNYKAYSPIRHAWLTSVIRITIMRNKRK